MKSKHKGLKIFGAIAGIAAICCIVPACVVSCGSSSNSSTSSTTNTPTLPPSLSGTTLSDVADNWSSAYGNYASSSNYGNWMKSNVENYAKNAPTYFSDLATIYAKTTSTSTSVKGAPLQIPSSSSTSGMPDSMPSGSMGSSDSTSDSMTGSSSMMNTTSSTPTTTTSTTKTYDLSGYLPFSTEINISMGSVGTYKATITDWLKLTSESLSNWTQSNDTFSFDLTQNYSIYVEDYMDGQSPEFTQTTLSVTQKITDATFTSTVLASLSSSLNSSNKQTMVNAGWYMSKCTSDVYSSSDFGDMQNSLSIIKDMMSNLGSAMLDTTNSSTSSTTSNSSNDTITGGTTFMDPTSSSTINSPLTTDFYYSFASYAANEIQDTFGSSSEFKVTSNWSDISNSGWLGSFAMNGIAGYALNNNANMTSSNDVNNPNTSLINSLKNPILHTVSVVMNLPTGTPSGSTTPMPSSTNPTPSSTTPTPTKTTPVSSSSLPTSLTGANFTDENTNWTQAWTKEMEDSNFSSWMENNISNYATNAPTYFSDLATQYDTLTSTSTSIEPMGATSATDLTGYLPFTSVTSSSATSSTPTMIYWFKLDSETASNISYKDATFSFTLTQKYTEYTETQESVAGTTMVMLSQPNTLSVTQSVVGAMFMPTLLAPLSDSLSSATSITPTAGWYMEGCTSDTFTYTSSLASAGILGSSLTGKTSFTNPSNSSFINSPVTSDFYNNYVFYPSSLASEESSIMKITDNASTLKANPWLTTVAETGIAGYALNGTSEIKGSSISYDASSMISNLRTNKIEYTETESESIPSGDEGAPTGDTNGTTGSDGMPTGIPSSTTGTSGSSTSPYGEGTAGSTGLSPTGTTSPTGNQTTSPSSTSTSSKSTTNDAE